MSETGDFGHLNDDARSRWDANAEWWDDRIGDGNDFQELLVEPATERLIEIGPGATVLDVACGAGRFGRRMAELGAHVVAIDFSERFIARARERTPPEMAGIEYRAVDATDREQLLALGEGRFDGAVATMCLMDMADVGPLFAALPDLLRPGGWFVFSVLHPCFQPGETCKFAEMIEAEGRATVRTGVKVSAYLTPRAWQAEGILGQPEPQWYFHRPLSVLLGMAFAQGFVLDALEEPGFQPTDVDGRHLRWDAMPEIPPVLVARLRLKEDAG